MAKVQVLTHVKGEGRDWTEWALCDSPRAKTLYSLRTNHAVKHRIGTPMDRAPPFEKSKLNPNYYRGVQCVMEIVSGLLHALPDSTEVFFGKMGDPNAVQERPNYQVICRGRPFVFLGGNHLPFRGRGAKLQPDQLREGPFVRQSLKPDVPPGGPDTPDHGWSYTDICGYAIVEKTEDDDGRFEEKLRDDYDRINLAENLDAIDDIGTDTPSRVNTFGVTYARDLKIREAVKRRAVGKCEFCGALGFRCSNGTRYLECRHIIALANDGADRMANVIALCPEHHREAHFGERQAELEKEMMQKVMILEGKAPTV
jgi:hypothetical protein